MQHMKKTVCPFRISFTYDPAHMRGILKGCHPAGAKVNGIYLKTLRRIFSQQRIEHCLQQGTLPAAGIAADGHMTGLHQIRHQCQLYLILRIVHLPQHKVQRISPGLFVPSAPGRYAFPVFPEFFQIHAGPQYRHPQTHPVRISPVFCHSCQIFFYSLQLCDFPAVPVCRLPAASFLSRTCCDIDFSGQLQQSGAS